METRNTRKTRTGKVVKNKMEKSIIVAIERKVAHPLYKKYYKRTTTFYAHDEKNDEKKKRHLSLSITKSDSGTFIIGFFLSLSICSL